MNPQDSLAQNFAEDLPWLAFLYVSEDLTPDEAADFEERLLTDQQAREAVALAMTMAEGLWMASDMDSLAPQLEPVANVKPSETQRRRPRWLTWAASSLVLAGLAFFVGRWAAHQDTSPEASAPRIAQAPKKKAVPLVKIPKVVPGLEGAGQLVEIWSDSQTLVTELLAESPVAESAEDLLPRESAETEDNTFAWMLAAVSPRETGDSVNPQPSDVREN